MQDSSHRVSETTQVIRSIARDIAEVSAVSKQMTSDSDHVRDAAAALGAQIDELRAVSAGFKVE
jgi:methyl-accepting chemotaxis protein